MGEFQRRRKQDSRQQLLAAATEAFCANGYFAISVDEIATAAGVSRMTFYRHFSSKAALAAELFRQSSEAAMPRLLAIGQRDFRERQVVLAWIAELFEANRASGPILRVFMQANAEELGFTQTGHSFITDLIVRLGQYIPAFALDPDDPRDRRGWVAAWLLLYEILDQGNHAARGAGVATDPLAIEILGERFLGFVNAEVRRGR
ncbi:TetR/AcrR family transcriptional regulator [Novosphingobium sp. G106]|uniref:TetR/AcrR family transcriptional regulator n=1 Tax=Novosphingobium sp. G106 TaxID=2849500 RepID=UPI001C2CFCAF|nr:TetR/AcrR family transcriptional regulator [Novosphingobium sp. G106]MBV1686161.1 TetR/AcrR family transcriptional regulator [Novosphingobium sp. G106]